jgi:catechol 2,3-dioxygenase-like lactoylglutathione lyase family enzyme
MAFVPARDLRKARSFYEGVLGLRFVRQDELALVLDAIGITVRVAQVPEFKPQQFTILGWEVSSIEEAVSGLEARGVDFESYGLKDQDPRGIWAAADGAKVAWFKDPDGNVLSVSQLS